MKILQFNNLSFTSQCRGQYEELKKISVDNGADISKIDGFEKTIQKIFPYNNQILKFKILGNAASFNNVAIQLINNDNKVVQQVEGTVIPRNIGYYTPIEAKEEKSKVFEKVVNMVRRLKRAYSTQLKNEQKIIEQDIKFKSAEKEITPLTGSCKCVISHDIDKIKHISLEAGYPQDKANEICDLIKEKFSDDKYNCKIFYLRFQEDDDSYLRKYVIYHGLTNNIDFNSKDYHNSVDISKTVISTGVTKEDRYKLLENVYRIIKSYY